MKLVNISLSLALLAFGAFSQAQNPTPPQTTTQEPPPQPPPQAKGRSAGGDIGSGTGDIGKGAAKGTGKAAEGVGKGVGDLVTLHPVGAAKNVGKGGLEAGKDVGVGAAKGTGKVAKGTGKLVAKPFHHSHPTETDVPAAPAPGPPQ